MRTMVNYGNIDVDIIPEGSVDGDVDNDVSVDGYVQEGSGSGGKQYVITKTTAEWNATPTRKSIKDTIYVYSDYRSVVDPISGETTYIPRMKTGDGTTYIVDLPFSTMSITQDDIDAWNNKSTLQVEADEETETLVFTE